MKPYELFALVYDYVLRGVDYEKWYQYVNSIMKQYVPDPDLILELGCGTGKFGAKFSRDNYAVYGLDNSMEMLQVAKLRAVKNFRIFCADMTNFYLTKKFDFIFSVHDTMNYFLDYNDIRKVLLSVKSVMKQKSVFMFDITTEYNILKNFHGVTTKYNTSQMDVEWSNEYNSETKLVCSNLLFNAANGISQSETHVQRIYTVNEISSLLHDNGFRIIDIYCDYSFAPLKHDASMINFITKVA